MNENRMSMREKYRRSRPHWMATTYEVLSFLSFGWIYLLGFEGAFYAIANILASELIINSMYIPAILIIGFADMYLFGWPLFNDFMATNTVHAGQTIPGYFTAIGLLGLISIPFQCIMRRPVNA